MKHLLYTAMLLVLTAAVGLSGCRSNEPQDEPQKPPTVSIISWNVLNPKWGGTPAQERCDGVFDTLTLHMPDVVGIQEADTPWHETFFALPSPYMLACHKTADGKDAMTMFFYNSQTLNLIESGIENLDPDDPNTIRVVSWGVFEHIDTGKRFLITNTHPDSRQAQCITHTQAYLEIAERLYAEKDLPMLSVGDFNAVEGSVAYDLHIKDGFIDCKYADGVSLVNDIDSYLDGDFGGSITTGKGSRDHIFFKGNITPVTFETLEASDVQALSDHLPIITKVTIP